MTRCASSTTAASKASRSKFRKWSRARSAGAGSPMKNWRSRFKPAGLRVGRGRRGLLADIGGRIWRGSGLTAVKPRAGRIGKLRGPYRVRALKAHWRVARKGKVRSRYAAARSRATSAPSAPSGSELIDLVMQKAQQLKHELGSAISPDRQPSVMETLAEIIASPSRPVRHHKKAPVEEIAPVAEIAPVEAKAPVAERVAVEAKAPVEGKAPVAERVPLEEKTLVAEIAPAAEKTPVAERVAVEAKVPVEEKTPVVEKAPVEAKAPIAESAAVEAKAPVEAKTPVEERAAVETKAAIEPERVAPARSPKRNGGRSPIASANLESAITEAIRKRAPGCESLVGVIVQPTTPKSRFDANWAVRGVKFGRADRAKVNEAIVAIVESMQREFLLTDD